MVFRVRTHHHDGKLLVVVDVGDHVVRKQHILIEQIADRQIFGIIADGHGRDDFLAVEKDRQSPLDRYGGLDPRASLVDAGHTLRQSRVVRDWAG